MRVIVLTLALLCLASAANAEGCEILFAARSQDCAVADSAMCWRKGDPLFARRVGFPWPRGENPDSTNDFVVITVTDKSPGHANDWLEIQRTQGDSVVVGLRLRQLIMSNLPQAVRDSLGTNGPGRYTTSWAQIKQFIRNLRTGGLGE